MLTAENISAHKRQRTAQTKAHFILFFILKHFFIHYIAESKILKIHSIDIFHNFTSEDIDNVIISHQ